MQDQNNELLFKTAYKILPELKIHVKIHVYFGNKAKGWISKRVLQDNKVPKYSEKRTFGVLCFLVIPVLRFAILPYSRGEKFPKKPSKNIPKETP